MAVRRVLLLAVALGLAASCRSASSGIEGRVRADADALLEVLRAGRWEEAVPLVSLDDVTRERMEIPAGASEAVIQSRVEAWFRTLYENLKPGAVQGIRFEPGDSTVALVTYRHGDLDGFRMRFAGGRWLYSVDAAPRR
jgi:hypothetical protein